MTPVPDQWRGPYTPRDPLNDPRPNAPWPAQTTPDRVEQERDAFQRALDAFGRSLEGQAR